MGETRLIGCHVSLSFLKRIEDFCRKNGYRTKSEFLRNAIRDKLSMEEKT